ILFTYMYTSISPIIFTTCFFFSSRRRHTRSKRDWSSDVCSSDLNPLAFAHAHQAVFEAVDNTQHKAGVQEALLAIEQNRSALSQVYFEEHGHISQDPFLAYSQDYHELAADMLRRALPDNAQSALEIGPGEGQFLQQIAPLFTHLMGIDRSQKMLQTAQERLGKKNIAAELVLGNWPHNAPAQQF